MGKEYHIRRTTWVSAFVVVVSTNHIKMSKMAAFYTWKSFCSVFWDLYCAAPERRDTCEHSSEAKAFHDYVSIQISIFHLIQQFPHYFDLKVKIEHILLESINKYSLFDALNRENVNKFHLCSVYKMSWIDDKISTEHTQSFVHIVLIIIISRF